MKSDVGEDGGRWSVSAIDVYGWMWYTLESVTQYRSNLTLAIHRRNTIPLYPYIIPPYTPM